MLWYKGWLETRIRLLFISALMGFILFFQYSGAKTPQAVHGIVFNANPFLVLMAFTMLAGAGVVTQPTMAVSKGIHGSTLFTLSLPVHPAPLAWSPSRNRMVGSDNHDRSVLLRILVSVPSAENDGDAGEHV